MENYNALLDQAEEWLDRNAQAEFDAWIDAQEIHYPEPSEIIVCEDYDDDF